MFPFIIISTKEKLYLGCDAYSAAAVYVRENSGSWQVSGKSAIGGFISGAIGGVAGGFITGFALSGGNFDKALSMAGQGATTMQELQPGDVTDRYGGTSNESRFASPEGVPLDQRSLSPSTNTNIYERYEVVKPFTVESGTVAPWFGQPCLGIQYQTQQPIKMLEMQGYLRFIP